MERLFTYPGTKYSLAPCYYDLIEGERHLHWVEVFGGTTVVTLNKPREWSKTETINDKNQDLFALYIVVQNPLTCKQT